MGQKNNQSSTRLKLEFPGFFEYQKERLFPLAKMLIILGALLVMGFAALDFFLYPDYRPLVLYSRILVIMPLVVILSIYTWRGEEKHFSWQIVTMTVISYCSFLYLNVMIPEKNQVLLLVTLYYLLSAMGLSPLLHKSHLIIGFGVCLVVQLYLILNYLPNEAAVRVLLPHTVSLILFTMISCVKLLNSAKEHYEIAKQSHDGLFIDDLTEIYNRKGIMSWGRTHFARPGSDQVSSLLVIDLDHFKPINDRYGHAIGDEVIYRSAQTIASTLNAYSVVGRLGGEEYLAVLVSDNLEANRATTHEIRERIKSQGFKSPSGRTIAVTASLGLTHDLGELRFRDLLNQADGLMYQAKARGRDQVVEMEREQKTA